MKTLFDENGRYTQDATTLDGKTMRVVAEIFHEYVEKGYSPREISHIMQLSIFDQELIALL